MSKKGCLRKRGVPSRAWGSAGQRALDHYQTSDDPEEAEIRLLLWPLFLNPFLPGVPPIFCGWVSVRPDPLSEGDYKGARGRSRPSPTGWYCPPGALPPVHPVEPAGGMDLLGSIVHAVGVFFERERIPAKDPIPVLFIILFGSIDAFVTAVFPPFFFQCNIVSLPLLFFFLPCCETLFSHQNVLTQPGWSCWPLPKKVIKYPSPSGGGDFPI